MKRFFSVLALNAFFLGIMLPCCTMQHSGTQAHTVAPSDVHEHVHANTAEPSSGGSSSRDSRQELCCYDDSLLAEITGSQIQAKVLLPLFVTVQIPRNLTGRFDRIGSLPFAGSLPPILTVSSEDLAAPLILSSHSSI